MGAAVDSDERPMEHGDGERSLYTRPVFIMAYASQGTPDRWQPRRKKISLRSIRGKSMPNHGKTLGCHTMARESIEIRRFTDGRWVDAGGCPYFQG